jgi:hypothetical protein
MVVPATGWGGLPGTRPNAFTAIDEVRRWKPRLQSRTLINVIVS